jgi:hypothetical protein
MRKTRDPVENNLLDKFESLPGYLYRIVQKFVAKGRPRKQGIIYNGINNGTNNTEDNKDK